jgi:uncharacterized protein (TIGR02246 family)
MPVSSTSQDLAAIADVRTTWIAAVAARNATRLRPLLDDDYEVWAHGAESLRGADAAVAAMQAALARYSIEQAFEPIETVVSGDWAFERGIERITIAPVDGAAPQSMRRRALLILHRGGDGQWRYARGMTNGLPESPAAAGAT